MFMARPMDAGRGRAMHKGHCLAYPQVHRTKGGILKCTRCAASMICDIACLAFPPSGAEQKSGAKVTIDLEQVS